MPVATSGSKLLAIDSEINGWRRAMVGLRRAACLLLSAKRQRRNSRSPPSASGSAPTLRTRAADTTWHTLFARPQLHADIRSMVTCPRWHPYRKTSERTVRSTVFLAHPTVAGTTCTSPHRRHLAWPVQAGSEGARLKSPAAAQLPEAARGGGGSRGRPGRRSPSTRGCGRGRAGGRARGLRHSRGARAGP